VAPAGIAPHYWTSAEAVLLLYEMLAYAEKPRATVVIGAGLTPSWLERPIDVEGIGTAVGEVSLSWDGHGVVTVELPAGVSVELCPAFPAHSQVSTRAASE
jgi:hypothetical protein